MSIRPETAKRLRDAVVACREIQAFCAGKSVHDMRTDRTLQLVVERLLEIAGEALRQAERSEPSIAERVPDIRDIVGTRNRLIHGYDDVDYKLLWDTVEVYVPSLKFDLDLLLNEAPSTPSDLDSD